MWRLFSIALAATLICGPNAEIARAKPASEISGPERASVDFGQKVGSVEEHEFRRGNSATHVYLDSTKDPYLFVAFPAGNSGVGLWFKNRSGTLLAIAKKPTALVDSDGLHGISFEMKSRASELAIVDAVLGSMRFLRDRELLINA